VEYLFLQLFQAAMHSEKGWKLMNVRRAVMPVVCLLASLSGAIAQQPRVDPRNTYERILAIVPFTGAGTLADPKRPLYAPKPNEVAPGSRTGIIAYTSVASDDGQFALVEFVAADRTAFAPILADTTVTAFLKGNSQPAAILATFQKYKKDFDLNNFGVRLP